MLILSDGFWDCVEDNGRALGENGLQSILRESTLLYGKKRLEFLADAITRLSGVPKLQDDLSAVYFEYSGLAAR